MNTFTRAMLLTGVVHLTACNDGTQIEFSEPEIITQGSNIYGANGLVIDPDGNFRVASVFGAEVVVLSPDGEIIDRIGPERNIFGPDDIAFGPDGSMYATNIITGEVTRLDPSGTSTIVANIGPGPNPVTVSDDGRVFVGKCFLGDGLFEIDPLAQEAPRTIIESFGGGCGVNGFDIGPDGALYAPRFVAPDVLRIDVNTGESTVVATGFVIPNGAKFDNLGRLTILDGGAGTISRFILDSNGQVTTEGEIIATGVFGYDSHVIAADSKIYATNLSEGQIWEVGIDGPIRAINRGGMTQPGGLAIRTSTTGADEILVADWDAFRIIDSETGAIKETLYSIIGQEGISSIMTFAPYDAGRDLFVTTTIASNSIKVWNYQTREVVAARFDIPVPGNAIGYADGLAVTSWGESSILWIDPFDPSKRVTLAQNIPLATGLATDSENLWAVDRASGRLLQIADKNGALPEPVTIATNLQGPEGLAISLDGRFLIVEADAARLVAIDPIDGSVEVIADNLSLGRAPLKGFSPAGVFNDVTVSESGDIYLTGDIDNVLYRIKAL